MKHKLSVVILLIILGPGLAHAETERLINTRDSYPSVSPDGEQLVFQSNRTGSNQIFVMNTDGSGLRQLADFENGAETPVFSPDGQHIVFAAYLGSNNNDVFVISPDGSGLRQLTDSPGYDGHPHWSFDSLRIVFNSDRTSPDPNASWSDRWHEIFSMKADGSDLRQHTRCQSVCTYGSVSPDGKNILYRKVIKAAGLNWALGSIEKNSEIYVSDLDGRNEVNLTRNAAFDGWPAWSVDGGQIAFASNRSGPALSGQIWLMNADGAGLRRLTEAPWSHAQPSWANDGKSIYAYQFRETPDYEFGTVVRIGLEDQ